jgi:murein DD-endopeptidase MepM/ murein hydrolase activator NlpD
MPILDRMTRAGALALAGLTAASMAAATTPEAVEPPAPVGPASVARLIPLADVREQGADNVSTAEIPPSASRLAPADVPRSIERMMLGALEHQQSAPRFPVAGPFNWGQAGARFGAGRGGRVHAGHDIFGRAGTPLLAISDSVVVEADEDGGRGHYIGLYDPAARRTYVYLHLQRPARARRGQRINAGERVGELGCSGSCFGDHLHFEMRRGRGVDGKAEDPLPDLLRWSRRSRARATLPPGAR